MPIYNRHYPGDDGPVGAEGSQDQLTLLGPTIPVAISLAPTRLAMLQSAGLPVPAPVTGLAMIDTGAAVCVIDEAVLAGLGITPFGTVTISTPTGSAVQPTYAAALSFLGTQLPNITFTDFVGARLQEQGVVALIGRSVLRNFIVIYNGPGGSVSVAY